VYTILMEDEMDGTGLRNVYTILMEDEMDGTGLRNVYTILMENLKGRHTSPPPLLRRCRQSLERNIEAYLSKIVCEGIDWTRKGRTIVRLRKTS